MRSQVQRASVKIHLPSSSSYSTHVCRASSSASTICNQPVQTRSPVVRAFGTHIASKTTKAVFSTTMARTASMPESHGHSAACCNNVPVVSDGYKVKGTYDHISDLRTYVTGPADATKGIIVIYDIFGFFEQTLQGADIIATQDPNHSYRVFMPDWFKGKPCPIEIFPPDTPEKQQKLGEFFSDPAHAPQTVNALLSEYVKAAQASNPSIKSWGVLGYCWGGKVAALATSDVSNLFSVAAVAHPAMIDPSEADRIKSPFLLLASGEESAEDVKAFASRLQVSHEVETFSDQVHGFMAARADLADPKVKKEYARGYQMVLDFFGKQWA